MEADGSLGPYGKISVSESQNRPDDLLLLWRRYLTLTDACTLLRKELRRLSDDEPELIVALLRQALASSEEKDVALDFVPFLQPSAQQQLFDALLPRAAELDVGSYNRAAQILLSLPQEWLKKKLQQSVLRFMENEEAITPELLDLYFQTDLSATRQLAERAASSDDESRRDLGKFFLQKLASAPAD